MMKIRGIEMKEFFAGVIIFIGFFVTVVALSFAAIWIDDASEKTKLQKEKNRLEIKRIQYEIKLMEEQGIPVAVE
jgi:hypothetical protein